MARVAALRAGLPVTTAGLTVNRFCNSGLQAIAQAAHMVLLEGVEAAIGGGVESITMMQRDNSPNPVVKEQHPGLYMVMGETAEVVAKRYNVSRLAQDEYSLVSQQRVARAQQDGFFAGEIAPIQVRRAILDKKTGEKVGEEDARVERDECNRADTTLEGLQKLAPVFDTDERHGQRHGRQLVAALGRRFGHAGDVERSREGARPPAAARVPRLRGRRLRAG